MERGSTMWGARQAHAAPHSTSALLAQAGGAALLAAAALCGCSPRGGGSPPDPQPAHAPVARATASASVSAAPFTAAYDMGTPRLRDLWVDPVSGDDGAAGDDRARPLRTLTAAWERVPVDAPSEGPGVRINLLPGVYPCEPGPEDSHCVNYFERRHGTASAPIVLAASAGRGTVTLRGGMNLRDVSYLYLLDLVMVAGGDLPTNSAGNNLLHLEAGDHVLLRGVTLRGPECVADTCNNLQEVFKANQCQHLYVEDSTIGGAWHTAVDWMVVQHGHVLGTKLYGAGQWCMYAKGGSAHLRLAGNEVTGCQLGVQAGQAANLAMMRTPYVHYEAYDVAVFNNVFHDIPGVPLSVAGGYDVLFAHNTLFRVATDPLGYPLVQVAHGERNCTPTDELPSPGPTCRRLTEQGAWGPTSESEGAPAIPARNVWIYDNIFYNPAPLRTAYTHFGVARAAAPPRGFVSVPGAVAVDVGLVIAGNVIWNGPADHPLGLSEAESGCASEHAGCGREIVLARNAVNVFEPLLVDPGGGDYRPVAGGALVSYAAVPPPPFPTADAPARPPLQFPELSTTVPSTRDGRPRAEAPWPGAL